MTSSNQLAAKTSAKEVDQKRLHHNEASEEQGCQIFLGTTYQKGGNIPNYHYIYWQQNIPIDRKIDQMAIKYPMYLQLQDPLKFTHSWEIWCKDICTIWQPW
jgi:hypothetical protein